MGKDGLKGREVHGMALGGSHVRETGEEGVAWERQLHAIRDLA